MIHFLDADCRPLDGGWTLLMSEAGAHGDPRDLPRVGNRLNAPVPGTVAEALRQAGLFDPHNPIPLHHKDAWYLRSLEGEARGHAVLRFDGLATLAEVYLNEQLILRSDSMFEAHDVAIDLTGRDRLAICFRALAPRLEQNGPRARWRSTLAAHQGLRLVRTTQLGYMPGWCPEIHAVGPWRPISLIRPGRHRLEALSLRSDLLPDGTGLLALSLRLEGPEAPMRLICGETACELEPDGTGLFHARLCLPGIAPWWPRSHGEPTLHAVSLEIGGAVYPLGLTGFRRIERATGEDNRDFQLRVNGEPIFCRGAVWTSADITRLAGSAEDYAPWLGLAAEAGMNMIRIGGTMTYESRSFFQLCDQLGLLVWQDLMLANFDYPARDETFVDHLRRELDGLLASTQLSPSLALVCGGSEIYQQGAMLGLPESSWRGPLTTTVLPAEIARRWPGLIYVENSPEGGSQPFSPDAGVTHYYGVGAYQRPLEDARRANVRFAAETLAFSQVPQQATLDRALTVPAVHDPRWKARVPRDRNVSWDFEDVRDHYLALLYDVEPGRLRREDPGRYLHLSRAVTGEVIEETFAEWRRVASSCHGALIWTLQDLLPGAGWGLIDATGLPKPVWYAARRAFAATRVGMTDEGTNGLAVHLSHDGPTPLEGLLDLRCLKGGRTPVVSIRKPIQLAPRSERTLAATDLIGAFFDTTYAFRFGPPSHDVTVASLMSADGMTLLSQAFHFPLGRSKAWHDARIEARLGEDARGWWLELSSDRLAQSVHVRPVAGRPEDDFFHLAPALPRRIRLIGQPSGTAPKGEILFAGSDHPLGF